MWRSKNANPVISFNNLRRLLGILGMALPLICYLGGRLFRKLPLQRSISYYYYSNAGDGLVGLLIAVGVFMVAYRGYELVDDLVSSAIGLCAIGVALFPCRYSAEPGLVVGFFGLRSAVSNLFHLGFAGLFFSLLAFNSLFLFTLGVDARLRTRNKGRRNSLYRACGLVIVLGILVLAAAELAFGQEAVGKTSLVFWVETIMLAAFGVSWLVKGETLLKDPLPAGAAERGAEA